ncbi:zinc finger protein 91-like [Oppia nitens]|uniref:zinc finger protein 91-like n=1 Tax=Oppia nitens TaxID=1686743 RepID=UPI0023DC3702|nr:zinc finger protein 91-like [Oppia nitens]
MTLSSSATTDSQIIAINYRRSYNCDYTGCGKQFRFICLLKKHIQMDHKEERPFKCDVDGCDQRFYRKEHIKRHKTYVHCDDKPFGCEWPGCGLRFKDKARVRLHHRQHTGVDRKVPGISGKFTRKKWKKQPKEIREYKCHYIGCDKVYRHRPNQLAIHIRTKHTGERPFKCPECDKTYPFERNLKIHMKSVHPIDRKEYKCRYDGCNREFRFESTLKHHYLRHENLVERQFKCDVDGCDKSFYRKAHLNDHKAYLHSDERPLPCEWPGCDKRFKFIHELRNHRERHTGVLQYRCDIDGCNKAFTSKSGLFSHKKSHTKPYVCSWPACEARFECNVRLTDHTYEHQGLKPHKCHFQGCVCSYSSRVSLRHHLKLKHNYVKSILIEMMANVMIKDVLDELSEENQRLFDELRYCQQLMEMFDKYRHLVKSLQTNCICIENIGLKTKFNELEDQYMTIKSMKIYDNKKLKTQSDDNHNDNNNDNNCNKSDDECDNNDNNNYTVTVDTSADSVMNEPIKRCRGRPKKSMIVLSLAKQKRVEKQLKSVNDRKVYKCDYTGCEKCFNNKQRLKIHLRVKHTNDRPFKCDKCDKTFPFQQYLKNHQKSVHTTVRKVYNCRYDGCDKQFRLVNSLKEHHLRHENRLERRFKCDVDGCDKSFYRKSQINTHKTYIHSDERPLPCEWPGCDKRFKFIRELNNHRERHTGVRNYRCDREGCNKSYAAKSGLFIHKQTHIKPFVCSWPACEARFECNYKLTDHSYEHQGLKPHKCHFQGCVCSYSSRVSLRHHLKLKHNYLKSICEKS